jgi:hypothetical protein
MRFTPRLLRKMAYLAVAVPAFCGLLAEGATRLLPACHINPYGLGECVVGGVNLAVPLLLASLGGLYFAVAALFLVALPLYVVSRVIGARTRRRHATSG